MHIHFRKATLNDVPFMSKMLIEMAAASGHFIEEGKLSEDADTYIFVNGWSPEKECGIIAENELGIPIGAAWVRNVPELNHYINYPTPELAIAILPEYRKMGIGEDLMNNLYKVCNASGINEISLGVHKDNLPAIRLYQKQGWIKEGDFHDYIMMIRKTN